VHARQIEEARNHGDAFIEGDLTTNHGFHRLVQHDDEGGDPEIALAGM
jgi:hypothetical protein